MNAVEIEEAVSALAAEPFDADEFAWQFLAAFGNKETTIKRLRAGQSNASDVAGGVLQRNNIHLAVAPNGATDARLRVIYSNGTESNLLLRSLQRALYKDEAGRRLTEPTAGPLFGDTADEDDLGSGTIYVLRSRSDDPRIAEHLDLIHKIGVTGGSVEARIAGAENDATYLLAGVDIVTTYRLYNINRGKLENLLHRVLGSAQLDIEIADRFGRPVRPREWFLAPLHVIDEIVTRIQDGTINGMRYEPTQGQLMPVGR